MTITYHAGRRIQGLSNDIGNLVTLDDNLSTQHAGWTANSSDITYDSGNGRINYSADGTAGYQYKALDLQHANFLNGSNLSDSKFLCRFKLVITSTNINSNSDYNEALFGLSSLDNAPNLAKDFLGFYIKNFGNNERQYKAQSVNNGSILGGGQAFDTVVSTGTYYIEIIRMSETQFTVEIFNADTYATGASVEKETVTISSSIQSLRFFYVGIGKEGSETGSNQGYIDDIKIYNGVTSLTSKPTNVQTGSRFEETDTRKIYFYKDPLVFEDDFTSYATQGASDTAWVSSDTAKMRVNITNDNIDFNCVRDSTSDVIYHDLTSVSDSAWVLRFKFNSTTITTDPVIYIGLSDIISSNATSQDFIGCMLRPSEATHRVQAIDSDHNNMYLLTRDTSITYQFVNSTTYYIEIIRTSTTSYTIKIFSDSAYTTQLGTTLTGTCASTCTSLRYLKIHNYSNDTTSDTWTGTIDDIKFYNGVTTISNYWTEES